MARPRLLVVDDDRTILEALGLLLGDEYDVVEVGSGHQALEALAAAPFDVMLLDLRMPDLSGQEVVRRARARGDDVGVVLMSAHADLQAEAAQLGVQGWLAKPFEVEAVELALAEVVAGRAS